MNTIDYCKLGAKIKAKRLERGYTQEKLAELCNISAGFLGHIENGTRKLSLDTLYSLSCMLKVGTDYLLLDSAIGSDGFIAQIDSVIQSQSPDLYNRFCKTVKILAEHIDEM